MLRPLRDRDEGAVAEASPLLSERRRQRAETIGSVLRSVARRSSSRSPSSMVLGELGFDIGPLIASAGIVGVALGFGAQSLVKDFLSGVFMILEDQYGVGDVVDLGEATGTVEAVGLRVTRLRDVDGTVWYVRNGEIVRVGNKSQGWARTVLDIPVAYGEDLRRIREVLGTAATRCDEDPEYGRLILEEPEVWGVERLGPDAIVVRVVLKTAPLEQWNVARELRERIKDRFDELGIEIPFPQRVVWMRQGEPLVDRRARRASGDAGERGRGGRLAGSAPDAVPGHRGDRLRRRPAGAAAARGRAPGARRWSATRPGCVTCTLGRRRRGRGGRRDRRGRGLAPALDGVDVAYYLRALDRRGRDFEDARPARGARLRRRGRRRPVSAGSSTSAASLPADEELVAAPALPRRGRRRSCSTAGVPDRGAAGRGDHRIGVGVLRDAALPHRAAAGRW